MTDVEEAAPTIVRKPGNMALWAALRAAEGHSFNNSGRVDVNVLTEGLRAYDGRCDPGRVNCSTLHDTRAMSGVDDVSNEERIEEKQREAVRARWKMGGLRCAPKRGVKVTPEMWRILEEAEERVRSGKV